jgi:hypothetical protein
MRRTCTYVVVFFSVACVTSDPPVIPVGVDAKMDAGAQVESGATKDADPVCTARDSIQSCGPSCRVCPTSSRGTATCDGVQCSMLCLGNAPLCSDKSCSRLSFDFSSNTKEGVLPASPAGLVLSVRPKDANLALAIDTDLVAPVTITVPICMSGTSDLSQKVFKARVFFDGGDTGQTPQYIISASLADFKSNSLLPTLEVSAGAWIDYRASLGTNAFSASASAVTLQFGSAGALFAGTVWLDDIELVAQ